MVFIRKELLVKKMEAWPILKSESMRAIFEKKAKYLKIWAKTYKILKYFKNGQVIACDNRTQ